MNATYPCEFTAASLCVGTRRQQIDEAHNYTKAIDNPTMLSPWWLPESPVTATECEEFPAPTDWATCRDLMAKFQRPVQVLFAVTAAEGVLWRWEKWVEAQAQPIMRNGKAIDTTAPRRCIELCYRWLKGSASTRKRLDKELKAAAYAAYYAAADAAADAAYAAYAAADAAYAAYAADAYAAADAAYAADAAAYAAYYAAAYAAYDAYAYAAYSEWWARFRSRLAITYVTTDEIEMGGQP